MYFTGIQTAIGLLMLFVGVIGLILGFRAYLNRYAAQQAEAQAKKIGVKKYQTANVFGWRNQFMGVGLACSLAFVVLMLGWTETEMIFDESLLLEEDILEMSEDFICCDPPPPPPPPPPPIIIVEIPNEDIEDKTLFSIVPIEKKETDTIPIEKEIIEELITIIEIMPVFPGCEDLLTYDERRTCTEKNLLKFVYEHLKYPSMSKDGRIEGLVVVQFVVDKEGSIHSPKIMKDIGGGCGAEAVRVVELMGQTLGKWAPGIERGLPVSMRYNLPVRFRLPQN